MFHKINVAAIITDHIRTLRRFDDGGVSIGDILLFFGLPLLPAAILPWRGVYLPKDSIGTLITAMAVFGALLFNLLLLVYDISGRQVTEDDDRARVRKQLLVEIHSNVAFEVLVTIVMVVVLSPGAIAPIDTILHPISVTFYYLGAVFVLTQLMVLKRIHLLMRRDVATTSRNIQ